MKKYLYLIKKAKIKSWLKFWLLTKDQVKYILSEILEGFSFNLQNTVKRYFKIFNIFGNSVQDGTPTPTNPVTIESVADDVNLFDIYKITTIGAITNNGDGTITITNSYSTSTNKKLSTLAPDLKVGDTYILNFETTGTNKFIYLFGANENWSVGTTKIITQAYLDSYVFVYGNNNETIIISGIKIAKGTEATPYSPYNYGSFTIDFEGQTENYNYTFITKPLRSLPNGVRDSLEDDGIHRRVGVLNLPIADMDNSENYPGWQNLPELVAQFPNQNTWLKNVTNFMCNIVQNNTLSIGINTNGTGNLFLGKGFFGLTQSQWKEQYPNLEVEIQYQLAEEIIEPYTEEQQEQYNKIKELYTFDGTTNISSDVVPPYLQIQYYMKGE